MSFRGAVLSQLPQAVITSSVATRHYGVSALSIVSDEEDRKQEIIQNEFTGREQVNKVRVSNLWSMVI